MKRVVVIGGGVGGLSVAAEISKAGGDVTVLEAHIYAGGCAGTFYHKGYRFDAGATLAGGFAPGGPMDWLGKRLNIDWEAKSSDRAMLVHLPDRSVITRWTDSYRWASERKLSFGESFEPFWRWQEDISDSLWDFALRLPSWPPDTLMDLFRLIRATSDWYGDQYQNGNLSFLKTFGTNILRTLSSVMRDPTERFRLFIDAQLMISAQTTSRYANALYGAVSLDLPRVGVAQFSGGVGTIAKKLVNAIRHHGGRVIYRQEVSKVHLERGRPKMVVTKRKEIFPADIVVFNLPPWNIAALMGDDVPRRLGNATPHPEDGWGAFMVYAGLDGSILPDDFALHHQVIVREPLGEGNSIFMSLSPGWDTTRAPFGKRALTISTHTDLDFWWRLYIFDQEAYEQQKKILLEKILTVAEMVIPGLRVAIDFVLPATPVTFQRFTRRHRGWVGGYPQTSLFRNWGPRLAPGLWMVGDSIFPGQSIPAVALGGIRVAQSVMTALE